MVELEKMKKDIDKMSREDMCQMIRFYNGPLHPYFTDGHPASDYFYARFKELGGFSPQISKNIGWN